MTENLQQALSLGDPQAVAALVDTGADIHYQAEEGYDALLDAVHGRDVLHDTRLLELLTLLIERGVSLTGMSSYGESGVRALSRVGRFDAVQFLLQAGANPDDLKRTELIKAVAFGLLADVEEVAKKGVNLEEQDFWQRTAWLVAIQTGDIAKAQFLLEQGASASARGRCGKPPLFYAIENGHAPMLRWLLESGISVHQTDDFSDTALLRAAQKGDKEAVDILLLAGADVNQMSDSGSTLSHADTQEVALRLLEAGADPQELSSKARRAILRLPPDTDAALLRVTADEFRKFRAPRFGTHNPEVMNNPFWEGMIRAGLTAYQAAVQVEGKRILPAAYGPIWCAKRFGQSLTFLEDGRIVQAGGEHEDSYDPDFCIYNDVFVHHPDGRITIYGYPKAVFPPTDFHTATLIGSHIYLVGSLGYQGTRQFGETPVYRLDTRTFQIERLRTTGDNPGWIYEHRAILAPGSQIQITGGTVATSREGVEDHSANAAVFTLNIGTLIWRRLA